MKPALQKTLQINAFTLLLLSSSNCLADQVISDDLIIKGSACIGVDCANGENFNFDTIRLKENNLRIRFIDSSSSSSFPSVDWELVANDSSNGGHNRFSIENVDRSTTPFTIMDGAKNHSLYVAPSSYIGIGTAAPAVNLHVVHGNSPALRLEQDTTSGFAAQAWDVGGNETNFFIRDITNSSALPLRIQTGAPNASIFVASDGDVGFETTTPDGQFDVAHSTNANNHAFLISPTSNVGVNIDNGFMPNALYEVQRTGGISNFAVQSDGDVGIGTATPAGRFDVRDLGNTTSYFNIDASGNVGLGTASPSGRFEIRDSSNTQSFLSLDLNGLFSHSTNYYDSDNSQCGGRDCGRFTPIFEIEETNASTTGRMMLNLKNSGAGWLGFENTTTQKQWVLSTGSTSFAISIYDQANDQFKTPLILDESGNITISGTLNSSSSKLTKHLINEVNSDEILDKIVSLPINSWSYVSDINETKHIGPMAQDFYSAFKLGKDDKHISNIDVSGVSLAAIQALYKRLIELELQLKSYKKDM